MIWTSRRAAANSFSFDIKMMPKLKLWAAALRDAKITLRKSHGNYQEITEMPNIVVVYLMNIETYADVDIEADQLSPSKSGY